MSDEIWRLRGQCQKFGDEIPHAEMVIPNWCIANRHFEPDFLIPHLFEGLDPGFHERVKPGDIIVAGTNFGMSPKMNGYIAMQALGLGLVCESMPFLGYRAALGVGLKVLNSCPGISDLVEKGDEIEIDFRTGYFRNHTQNVEREYSPIPSELHELVSLGGAKGCLQEWWRKKKEARTAE